MGNPSKSPTGASPANQRAQAAATAVMDRHLHRALGLPGTRIAAVAWPPGGTEAGTWHYWWQAHLVDLLVDAAVHRPADATGDEVSRLIRGVWLRNLMRWTNSYHDDMAWLGLAIQRADRQLGTHHGRARSIFVDTMLNAWAPRLGGGLPWRTHDVFFNAPSNGPATILVARAGYIEHAARMAAWMDSRLVDPTSHLVIDGITPSESGGMDRVTETYTYCQGVVLGAELECLRLTGDDVHLMRIERLVSAVETQMCPDGVIPGRGGGDGGLFAGILARYLALVATDLPASLDTTELRERAGHLVTTSAEAAWTHRTEVDGRPLFGADWHRPARVPTAEGGAGRSDNGATGSSEMPERDLSVQLSAWMVLEAAASVELGLREHDQKVPT